MHKEGSSCNSYLIVGRPFRNSDLSWCHIQWSYSVRLYATSVVTKVTFIFVNHVKLHAGDDAGEVARIDLYASHTETSHGVIYSGVRLYATSVVTKVTFIFVNRVKLHAGDDAGEVARIDLYASHTELRIYGKKTS
jgi:hypothetical protein